MLASEQSFLLESLVIECEQECLEARRLVSILHSAHDSFQTEVEALRQNPKHEVQEESTALAGDFTDACAHASAPCVPAESTTQPHERSAHTSDSITRQPLRPPLHRPHWARGEVIASPSTRSQGCIAIAVCSGSEPLRTHTSGTAAIAPVRVPPLDSHVTTLIVRRIPRMSQESLLKLWPPTWGYDFFYLPYNIKQRRSSAYAFISFVSNEAAQRFYSSWEDQNLTARGVTKALSIRVADVQGVLPNIHHLLNCGIEHTRNDDHLPAMFYGTSRINFRDVLREVERQSAVQ